MYLDYWQLDAKPFEPGPGPDGFHFPCDSHEGALAKLLYGVENGRSAVALAGPSGVGKTMVVSRLIESLPETCGPMVRLAFPQMSGRDLLAYLAQKLGAPAIEPGGGSVEESVRRLEALAEELGESGRRPLVVIDEAHLLEDAGAMETLRLLTNFEAAGRPAWTIAAVGQMPLLSSMARWPALDERLGVKTLLRPFTPEETAAYVRGRLAAAGASRELFEDEALERLHALAGGIARRINRLCDLALVVGMAEGAGEIGPSHLGSVHRELIAVGSD